MKPNLERLKDMLDSLSLRAEVRLGFEVEVSGEQPRRLTLDMQDVCAWASVMYALSPEESRCVQEVVESRYRDLVGYASEAMDEDLRRVMGDYWQEGNHDFSTYEW
jgi:hypothetical protein